jgi:hypothetical protein
VFTPFVEMVKFQFGRLDCLRIRHYGNAIAHSCTGNARGSALQTGNQHPQAVDLIEQFEG